MSVYDFFLDSMLMYSYRSECQVKDWKSGTHKTICGKPLTEEDLASLRIGPGAVSPPPSGTDRQH